MSIISGGAIFESTGFTLGLSTTSVYQNVPVSITVFAIGGVSPYTFAIVSGSLPTGLSLNQSTGIISGTPTGTGASSLILHATDSNSNTLSLSATITVYVLTGTGPCSAAICITTGSVNELATLQLISLGYFSDGSTQNLTSLASYSCTGGTGCTGSTISSTGLFTAGSTAGSATVQASFSSVNGTGTVTVTNSNTVVISYPTTTLPNGQQYQPYSEGVTGDPPGQGVQILATGGVAPYTCSISTGSLPTGMSLSNVAGNTNCLIGGTPTTSGAGSSFVVKVQDSSSNSSTVTISSGITVVALANIAVGLNQSTIIANTTTNATALGQYTDSSTAFLPSGLGGASFVQKQSAITSSTVTSLALSAMSTTTGNMLVVFQTTGQGGTTCPSYSVPTDTAGNTYAAATTSIGGPGSPPPYYNCGQIFYSYNITGNAANITTCHTASTTGLGCAVFEYSGIGSSDPRDQHPAPTQANPVSACTPNSVTTGQANELGFIVCLPNSATGYTLPSGYISRDSLGSNWIVADQVYSATQSSIAPVTSFSGGATGEDSFIVTFKSNTPTTGGVVWSSGTPACAVISSQGVVTGEPVQTACTSVITATVGAVSNTATITVNPSSSNTDTGIIISPPSASQALGLSVQFVAKGNNTGQTYAALWGSSNTSIATIGTSSGLATCASSPSTGGTVNISAAVSGFTSANASFTCTQAAIVNWTSQHQIIDGFGANDYNDTGSAQPTLLTSAQAAFFFGTGSGQIGLSILRTGSPDNMATYSMGNCTSVSSSCAGTYSPDIQLAASYGVKLYVTPFAVPQAYSTLGGIHCNGTLATAHYADFATWLTNFVKSQQTLNGISVLAVSIQNEPDFCGSISPATAWSATQMATFIGTNLGPTFASNGLSSVLILEPDTSKYGNLNGFGYGCTVPYSPTCNSYLGGYSFHDYDATVTIPSDTVNDTPLIGGWTSPGGRYWMSEVSCQSGGGGPSFCTASFAPDINNALGVAALIDKRLAVDNVNAWLWWWLMLPQSVASGEALLANDTGAVPLRTYVLGQYSKFIRPGYYRIDATHAPQNGVSLSAYQNTTGGNLVIVATNYTSSAISQSISITNTGGLTFSTLTPYITSGVSGQTIQAQAPLTNIQNNTFSYQLPAQSVTTFVGVAGTSGTVIPAAGCDFTSVNSALTQVNNLSGTVTVTIPSCAPTPWTQPLSYSIPAAVTNLTIQGQSTISCTGSPGTPTYSCSNTANTTIVDSYDSNGGHMLVFNNVNNAMRVTGINFVGGNLGVNNGKPDGFMTFGGSSTSLRVDHCLFDTTMYAPSTHIGAMFTLFSAFGGVADHNIGYLRGESNGMRTYPEAFGDVAWSQPTNFGQTLSAYPYFFLENNVTFGGFINDCNQGGRNVIRYNNLSANPNEGDTGGWQGHQTSQGTPRYRGCRALEVYNNYAYNPTPAGTGSPQNSVGGGGQTGLCYNNITSTGYKVSVNYANDRQLSSNNCGNVNCASQGAGCAAGSGCCPPPCGFGYCGTTSNGISSPWDGNSNSQGYPCLGQTGRGQGQLLNNMAFPNALNTVTGTAAWPQEMLEPWYVWNEMVASGVVASFTNWGGNTMMANRDAYIQVSTSANTSPTSPFNGTVGTGFGTFANRPTTCTAGAGGTYGTSPTGSYGVGYFDTTNNVLWVCTASNVWTNIYTPYQYPHPLNH